MDVALDSLRAHRDPGEVNAALSLMQVYINNIVKDPGNEKFRKIRISNSRFNSAIWQLEPARTFLLFCGFEQQDEGFLVVPSHVSLDGAKALVDGAISTQVPATPSSAGSSIQQSQPTSVLKLGESKGESLLAPDVKADLTLLSYMKDMGYNVKLAERALIVTKNAGVQPAMDWITANPDITVHAATTANAVEFINTGGNQDSSPAPVSRYQKTAKEKHKFQEKQRQEAIGAARLEKQQTKLQKQYLLQEMKGEKEAKKEMTEQTKRLRTCGEATESMETSVSVDSTPGQQCAAELYTESQTELRIRLPDGQVSILSLPSDSPLQAVYQHVCRATGMSEGEFILMTSFPQVELSNAEMTLTQAGLSPRAAILVTRRDQQGLVTQGQGAVVRVRNISSIEEWQDAISKAKDELLVAKFYASWCANSRSVSDAYDALNANYCNSGDRPVQLVRVDIEKLKVLKYQQRIRTTPTFRLFWNEKVIGEVTGTDLDKLQELVEANRSGPSNVEMDDQEENEVVDDPR